MNGWLSVQDDTVRRSDAGVSCDFSQRKIDSLKRPPGLPEFVHNVMDMIANFSLAFRIWHCRQERDGEQRVSQRENRRAIRHLSGIIQAGPTIYGRRWIADSINLAP
jgi:hypothetical protein